MIRATVIIEAYIGQVLYNKNLKFLFESQQKNVTLQKSKLLQMKNLFLLLCVACMTLSSCKSLQTYYQICEVQSSLPKTETGRYEFKDNACVISYDFWCNGGNPGFLFTNNTDEIIYVDLSKSFFVKDGIAYDYFLNRRISSSSSFFESSTALKSGSAYGYWNAIGGLIPGSITASIGSGSSASKSSSIETFEKCIVAIPPHTSKVFSEYSISSSVFYYCENNITPSKKENSTYSYELINSPLTFENYVTYRIGDNEKEHTITNDFFVKEVSFYHADAVIIEQTVGCPNDTRSVEVVKGASPDKFYIRYERSSRSTFPRPKGPNGNVRKDYDWY